MCFNPLAHREDVNEYDKGAALSNSTGLTLAPLPNAEASVQSKRMVLLASHASFIVHAKDGTLTDDEQRVLAYQQQWTDALHQPLFAYDRSAPLPPTDHFTPLSPTDSPRRLLFDLGASYYRGWAGSSDAAVATSWFVSQLSGVHPPFDRIIAFEYETLPPATVYSQIPMSVLPYYTFINVGCVSEEGSPLNPWNLLVQLARPQDFVLVKLDIDTPSIEGRLVEQILNNVSISSRIDEMAYEHHVYVPEMQNSWRLNRTHPEWLSHSYQLFTRLRQLGIRMHSWP